MAPCLLFSSLLTQVGQKTTALFEAKSNEANLQKQCEELKIQKKNLEDRTTINNNEEEVKAVPTVNIKPEPEMEREVKDDDIKVKVDQIPRTLGVFDLGSSIREKDLLEEFEVFGRLESATIVMDPPSCLRWVDRKGRSKGYGFVKFLDPV